MRDSQNRVMSMALIHETLYRSKDIGKIDFRDYSKQPVSHLFQSYAIAPGRIDFRIDAKGDLLEHRCGYPLRHDRKRADHKFAEARISR